MNNQKQLKKYVTSFISTLKHNVKQGYSISANIHPANGNGATIEFEITDKNKANVVFSPTVETINKTLESVEQRLIGGNIEGVTFAGTNVYMDENKIVIIKGSDDHDSWSNRAATGDVKRVISPRGEKK